MAMFLKFVIFVGCLVTLVHGGNIALTRSDFSKNIPSQRYVTNQTRDDDVDVKVEVNVSGRNSTTMNAPRIKTDKEVLQKILHNPYSKEHVKAVKILKALVKHLKVQNITNNVKNGANAQIASKNAPKLAPSKSEDEISTPKVASSHVLNTSTPRPKKVKRKPSKKKRRAKRRKSKSKKQFTKAVDTNKLNETVIADKNATEQPTNNNKGSFTETLKQAIIEGTVKALRKAYHNRTMTSQNQDENSGNMTTSNESEKSPSFNRTETNSNFNNTKSITSDFESSKNELGSNEQIQNATKPRDLPFYETTNVNIPAIDNQTRVVTNIYKIIIHKNDTKDLQPTSNDYISQQNKDTKIESFTRITNDSESGSAGNPDDYDDDINEDDEDDINANINRNKASTMTGKTLTITFQENAANLGGSSKIEQDPVLPGSSRLNLKVNQNDDMLTSSKENPLIEETFKTDTINITDGLLHDSNAVRPQKLFNDSLFEEAGMKANDKKQNHETEEVTSEKTNKKSVAVRPKSTDKTNTVSSAISIGEEIDGPTLDGISGSGVGSGSIGDELFFARNERLSDLAEMDRPIPIDDSKQMKEKRDIITASVKSFASNLLNHKLFIRKHPVNRLSVNDRDKPFKKHNILNKKKHSSSFTKLHPQKSISVSAEKRNELKLHKFDKKNISLEDMSWNGDAARYGSLVFKRNIVSEDDEPQMDSDQSSDRFHKEMILSNHQPSIIETNDKIFHNLPTSYNRRNEIPSREKLVAKREVVKKHKKVKNFVKKKHKFSHAHQEIGDKRLTIPVEVIGNDGETVDDLYKFGTEAGIHTRPIFSDNLDPFTQAVAEKEKFAMTKSIRPNIQSPLSIFDTPIITGGPNVPQTQPGPSPVTQEDEREAGQELLSYKNNLDLKTDSKLNVADNLEGLDSNISPLELQASEMTSNNGNPQLTQQQGEAQMNEEAGVTEMESNADPTAISPEMNQLENRIEQPLEEKPVNVGSMNAEASINLKDEASKIEERAQAQETMQAEQKLREMELARAQFEIKARDRENAEALRTHSLQRQAIHPLSRSNNTLKLKPQIKQTPIKQIAKPVKSKPTGQIAPVTNRKKINPISLPVKNQNKAKPLVMAGKIQPIKASIKAQNVSNHTDSAKAKTNAWHLKVTKENAISTTSDADMVLSKRYKMKTGKKISKRDIDESKNPNDRKTDVNESDKVVTTEADIPGVFAVKTDRKINRDFGGDNVDTETIVDDVRKRTPKLKNDVLIDEGLDTAKRHDVKKSGKTSEQSTNQNSGSGKQAKLDSADSDIQDIHNQEVRANLLQDGSLKHMDKNGFISNTQIVDSETPTTKTENNEYTSETMKKLDAVFNSEY